MADSLVSEIQRDALDESKSVSSLLRKVKLAASKLGLEQIEGWVEHELNGYGAADLLTCTPETPPILS